MVLASITGPQATGLSSSIGVERPPYYGNPAGVTREVEVVRAIYAAFARRDIDAALAHLHPDCELYLEGTARAAGRAGPYRGHEGMREYLADVARLWEELTLHADDFRAVPGSVIVLGHVTGRRDGERFHRTVVWTWRVTDGKAVAVRAADMGDMR